MVEHLDYSYGSFHDVIEDVWSIHSFRPWQVNMQTFLTQPRVAKAILLEKDKMLATLMEDQKAEIKEKAMKTIQLCLFDEISREVLVEKTIIDLWPKLESLYMMKLLTKVVFKALFLHIYIYILNMAEVHQSRLIFIRILL